MKEQKINKPFCEGVFEKHGSRGCDISANPLSCYQLEIINVISTELEFPLDVTAGGHIHGEIEFLTPVIYYVPLGAKSSGHPVGGGVLLLWWGDQEGLREAVWRAGIIKIPKNKPGEL